MGNLGKYEISLGSDKWEKKILGAEFEGHVDAVNELRVDVSHSSRDHRKLRATDLPQEALLQWQGKKVFSGKISHVVQDGRGRITLSYEDDLQKTMGTEQNQFHKEGPLREALKQLVSEHGLSANFQGNFSVPISGFRAAGKDTFSLLEELAENYGFFFNFRGKKVQFIAAGESIERTEIDEKDLLDFSFEENTSDLIEKVEIKYLDAKTMEPQEQRLSQSDLYGPISKFKKNRWRAPKRAIARSANNALQYENASKYIPQRLSKKLLGQDQLVLRGVKYMGLPGDALKVKGHRDGDYFVQKIDIKFQSSLPVVEATVIRG